MEWRDGWERSTGSGQGRFQYFHRRRQLLLPDRQRRHDLPHPPLRAAGEEEDARATTRRASTLRRSPPSAAGFPRAGRGPGSPRRPRSGPARRRGVGRGSRRGGRPGRGDPPPSGCPARRGRRRRRAGWRGRSRCGAPRRGLPAAEEVAAGDHGGDRQASSQRLAAAEEVRPHPLGSTAKRAPRRPKPVKISSAISSAPWRRQIAASPASQPAGGISTPSRPTTGSTIAAPISALREQRLAPAPRSPPKGSRRTCPWRWAAKGARNSSPRGDGEGAEGQPVVGGLEGEDARPAGGSPGPSSRRSRPPRRRRSRRRPAGSSTGASADQPPRELDAQRMRHDVPQAHGGAGRPARAPPRPPSGGGGRPPPPRSPR